jgi:hypothetical protein
MYRASSRTWSSQVVIGPLPTRRYTRSVHRPECGNVLVPSVGSVRFKPWFVVGVLQWDEGDARTRSIPGFPSIEVFLPPGELLQFQYGPKNPKRAKIWVF